MQHDSNSAQLPKAGDKPGLNWRQRKKLVARRKQLEEEAAARKPQMIQAYVDALGGNVTEIQRADIERAIDLTLIASELRTAVRLGTAKVSQLTTLEGHADRARRRLGLPEPGNAAPVMGLHDIVARRAAERANPPTEGSD
jgi:hypothetical protein